MTGREETIGSWATDDAATASAPDPAPAEGGSGQTPQHSPYLAIPRDRWLASNRLAFAVLDRFPVSPGHTLVVPHRQVAQWWDATRDEQTAIMDLVDDVRQMLLDDARRARILPRVPRPDAFNVGFNAGDAAGQTVPHLHVHVIPRFSGDMDDPRGGVRHVIPDRGNYLAATASEASPMRFETTSLYNAPGLISGSATEGSVPSPTPVEAATAQALTLHDAPQHPLGPALADAMADPNIASVDLLVSFVMVSGLDAVQASLDDLLDRGGRIRMLTSDYLGITEKRALGLLLARCHEYGDRFRVRVYRAGSESFHPKAYMLWGTTGVGNALSFVGSANLSRPGLRTGVEWTTTVRDPTALATMRDAFEQLWLDDRSEPLTQALLDDYLEAPRALGQELVPIAPPTQPVAPTAVQGEALDALAATRAAGFGAGLVVMATGLGKSWLAAFDSTRPEFARVLFIAHREEILNQTRDVFRRIQPDARIGLIKGPRLDLDADIVLASVQTLAERLDQVPPDRFDYVVVDEFHHAAAGTYRRVIDHVRPKFLLGLTATPERTDNADLLVLCEDNLVFECGLADGIADDLLVPFEYFGVPDAVDFRPLPWRNSRFDPAALEHAIVTQERIAAAFDAWAAHSGDRTLAFCVSQRHADVMAQAFQDRGVRAVAVHAGDGSAPRHASLDAFARGDLDVIFSVDLFNEGLDVPAIDTILLLRPTASPVVFLQQLGRGLRRSEGKTHVTAIDFVGNHRSFLTTAKLLAGLAARGGQEGESDGTVTNSELRRMLTDGFTLPPGCKVHYELTAVETLLDLLPSGSGSRLESFVQAWVEERGVRPTAVQTSRAGFNPAAAPGTWFAFLDEGGHLADDEARTVRRHGALLAEVAGMSINKSYKLVALRALLRGGWLASPAPAAELAATSRWLVLRDPRLVADVVSATTPDPSAMTLAQWESYWRKWPLAHLAKGGFFRLSDATFGLVNPASPEDAPKLTALIDELLDWRLTRYLGRVAPGAGAGANAGMILTVSHTDGKPILRFDRASMPDLPVGRGVPVDIGGRTIDMDFMKIAVNVAREAPGGPNILADVLRGWFGPDAGRPGTWHQVRLTPGPPWRLDPVRRATDGEDPGAAGGEGGVHGSAYPDGATRSSSAHD